MDHVLAYFNPQQPGGRIYLANVALILALCALPGYCAIYPGIILSAAAFGFAIAATRYIQHNAEPRTHQRAQIAFFLAALELLLGCTLTGLAVSAHFFR